MRLGRSSEAVNQVAGNQGSVNQGSVILAGISILGIIAMALFRPAWGLFNWWPLAGLGLSLSLIVIALVKGASMAAQGRMDMIDTMNDCNVGILRRDDA
jgi:hypothetical protein